MRTALTIALEVGERLKIPAVVIPHSLGINKVINLKYDPDDPETWIDKKYNFGTREDFEMAALRGANFEIANTWREPDILKKYYGKEFPHLVMPAGAGNEYVNIHKNPQTDLLDKFNLIPHGYFLYFGRFSEAKNVPGVVQVFGEARRIEPRLIKEFKLVLVGGSPEKPRPEEINVEKGIIAAMKDYGLSKNDVIRLPSQTWKILAVIAHHCSFYIGMQEMEPFGMAVAEAMAAHAPVMISKAAGITKWIQDGREAIVVDPDDPRNAAQRLIRALNNQTNLNELVSNGYTLSLNKFSWEAIGRRQGEVIDLLCQGKSPLGTEGSVNRRKIQRAYHRSVFAWRGDVPVIKPKHKKAAAGAASVSCRRSREGAKKKRAGHSHNRRRIRSGQDRNSGIPPVFIEEGKDMGNNDSGRCIFQADAGGKPQGPA